jgi:hypothetical protein
MATAARGGTTYTGASPGVPASVPYAATINAAARANRLDPWWLAGLLKVENGFKAKGDSPAGAVGIAQILLSAHPDVSRAQAENPAFAIPWAARYLATLRRQAGGSLTTATAWYNTGPAGSKAAGNAYVSQVKAATDELRKAGHAIAAAFTPGKTKMTPGGGPDPWPYLNFAGHVDWQHVDQRLWDKLNAVGQKLGKKIDVFSGYRSDDYAAAGKGGFPGDPHTRGIAADANIGGVPLGSYPGALALLTAAGLRSGNQPNFYQGKPDPSHVDLGAAAHWVASSLLGSSAVGAIPGVNAGTVVDAVTAPARLAALTVRLLSGDTTALAPLADGVLWLLFMLTGFALLYLGVTRLVGVAPIAAAREQAGQAASAAAAAGALA